MSRDKYKVGDEVYLLDDAYDRKKGDILTVHKVVGIFGGALIDCFYNRRRYSLWDSEIELYKGVNPMALKFKIGDLVKTTSTVGLDFQSFPIGSEATVKELVPRSGIAYPYIVHLIQYNRDVAVMEKEIDFVNQPTQAAKAPPIYKKFIGQSHAAHWYIVEDNHGTHYTVLDTSDHNVIKGQKYNKQLFVNFREDTNFVPTNAGKPAVNLFKSMPSIKDLLDDTLPLGQGNQVQTKPSICTCGAEKTYGPNTKHSTWCDKKVSA